MVKASTPLEVVMVLAIAALIAFYARSEYVPPFAERHVEAAAEKYDLDIAPVSEWFSAWSIGDGQAFAVIAADPSGMKLSTEIKEPAYRFSRAGYGWLSSMASLGREQWIPYGMALVGALALAANAWMAVSLRDRLGARSWLLIANPALYIGFAGDTAEPLALFLLTLAMASGTVWSSMALGVTRPSYLVALITRKRQFALGLAITAALLTYSIVRFGTEQLIPDGGRFDLPVRAYIEHPSLAGWILLALAVGTVGIGVWERDWAWGLSGLLVLALGSDVTVAVENAWRAAGMLPVLWAFGPRYQPDSAVVREDLAPSSRSTGT